MSGRCVSIFSNTFWSIFNFRRSLIKELQQQGVTVIAVSANDAYREAVEALGCQTIIVENLDAKSTSIVKELKLIWEVRKIFTRLSCEYIYTFTIKPNIYTALTNVFGPSKTVITVNGLGNVFSGGSLVRTISLNLFRLAFRQAHRIVFQNRDDFSFFKNNIGLSAKKVLFVRGSGVNTKEFTFSQRPAQPGVKLVFLMACRLLKEKGVYEYIEAARRVHQSFNGVQFWLIGMKANNQSAIDIKDLQPFADQGIIRLVPPTDDINGLLETVDVLVLPSYYNEGVPRILLEGLAKGLPIITTNSVGCKETVADGRNGYLIPPKNIDALEEAVRNMVTMSGGERLKMREESRKLAETEFDEARVIDTYIGILHPEHLQVATDGA